MIVICPTLVTLPVVTLRALLFKHWRWGGVVSGGDQGEAEDGPCLTHLCTREV